MTWREQAAEELGDDWRCVYEYRGWHICRRPIDFWWYAFDDAGHSITCATGFALIEAIDKRPRHERTA